MELEVFSSPYKHAMIELAVVSNSPTPYRIHFHSRITREVRHLSLHAIYTHGESNSPWQIQQSAFDCIYFGIDEKSENQSRLIAQRHEWKKGGEVCKWIAKRRISAIVLGGYNDLGRLRILRYTRRRRIPFFLWADSNIRCESGTGIKKALKKQSLSWVCRVCTGVLVCGRLGADYFKSYGAREDSIFFVPYEPDYSVFSTSSVDSNRFFSGRYNFDNQRRRMVFSGRLVPAKRTDLVVNAFIELADLLPDWDLIIAGDGILKDSLQSAIPVRLKERVKWLGFIDSPFRGKRYGYRIAGTGKPLLSRLGSSDALVMSEILFQGEYDQLFDLLNEDIGLILDLGANCGFSTRLWFDRFPNAKVVAVEPDGSNFDMLKANNPIELLSGRLIAIQACIGASDGNCFFDRSQDAWAYSVTKEPSPESEPMQLRSMESILVESKTVGEIDLLKCDIEGSERDLLSTCGSWISRVNNVLIELHPAYSYENMLTDISKATTVFEVSKVKSKGANKVYLLQQRFGA